MFWCPLQCWSFKEDGAQLLLLLLLTHILSQDEVALSDNLSILKKQLRDQTQLNLEQIFDFIM